MCDRMCVSVTSEKMACLPHSWFSGHFARTRTCGTAHHTCACTHVPSQPIIWQTKVKWMKLLKIVNNFIATKGTSINDVPRFFAIFDLPTYFVLLYNIRFFWLSWTLLPTPTSDVIYGHSLLWRSHKSDMNAMKHLGQNQDKIWIKGHGLTNTTDSKTRCTRSIRCSTFSWTLFSMIRSKNF